jgi:hypothetical protein
MATLPSHRAVAKLKTSGILQLRVRVRSCKYLNNVVEQDHRRIKQRNPADARIQAIRDGGRNDPRHRTGGENQETTIQPQITNRKSTHRSGNVGRGLGGLKPGKSFAPQKRNT